MIKTYDLEKITDQEKKRLMKRSNIDIQKVKKKVEKIIKDVKENGDASVKKYTKGFDKVQLENLKVSRQEIKKAWGEVDNKLVFEIKKQIKYSKKFHINQLRKDKRFEIEKGITVGEKFSAIESVGLYVPGGRASYPTVLQILAVPALIAGVERVVVCTPPNKKGSINPSLLVAADLTGVDEIYKIGGAQAIAALAYGTESVKPVKKIVGPGNIYVNAAKMCVFGKVDIDMPAGPSEALIVADSKADSSFVAADILARCEHDVDASAVLVTDSKKLKDEVTKEINRQLKGLKRKEIIKKSLSKYSAIVFSESWIKILDFVNDYAAEHLELMVEKPWELLPKIKNAGSVFLGYYAPVAVGDYASGTNHVLPTGGFAKIFSPVGVETFQKKTEFQYLTQDGLKTLEPIVRRISKVEQLDAHYNSINVRFQK